MNINYYNFRLICGRVFFLANGVLREARYGLERADLLTSASQDKKSVEADLTPLRIG